MGGKYKRYEEAKAEGEDSGGFHKGWVGAAPGALSPVLREMCCCLGNSVCTQDWDMKSAGVLDFMDGA